MFDIAKMTWGSVNVIHLDNLLYASNSTCAALINRITNMNKDTSLTLFLLLSLKFLILHEDFRKKLIIKANTGVLRLIKIDEVHLYVQHGVTFRHEIWILKGYFLWKCVPVSQCSLSFLLPCSYCNNIPSLHRHLFHLTMIGFPKEATIWPYFHILCNFNSVAWPWNKTQARNMLRLVWHMLSTISNFTKMNVCVLVNTCSEANILTLDLQKKLNEASILVDAVPVHGHLDKN